MKQNVGTVDRNVRLVVGAILILAAIAAYAGLFSLSAAVTAVVFLVGVILFGTGAARTCLIYSLLGLDTAHADGEETTADGTTGRTS